MLSCFNIQYFEVPPFTVVVPPASGVNASLETPASLDETYKVREEQCVLSKPRLLFRCIYEKD